MKRPVREISTTSASSSSLRYRSRSAETGHTLFEEEVKPDIKTITVENDGDPRPIKRRRMIVEVVVPIKSLHRRRVTTPKKLTKTSKTKAKSIPKFELDSVYHRIDAIGHEQYAVTLPPHIQNTAAPRSFFSDIFGGNRIRTFPPISKRNLRRHGYDHFMFPKTDYNPYLPQVPGAAGLKFFCTEDDRPKQWQVVQKTIARLPCGLWLYMGEYALTPAPCLTKEEWLSQQTLVRRTWASNIHEHEYGKFVRARIALRRKLRRKPTNHEVETEMKAVGDKFKTTVTVDDVKRAYDRGEEAIAVWCMKCVGYDEKFQREVFEKYQASNGGLRAL